MKNITPQTSCSHAARLLIALSVFIGGANLSDLAAAPQNLTLSSDNDILSFDFGALGEAKITGEQIVLYVYDNVNITALSPTYEVSPLAAEDTLKPSGSTVDFSTPQTYAITAEDDSVKQYTVIVSKLARLTYDFNDGMQGWTQIYPDPANTSIWSEGLLRSYDNSLAVLARSPVFELLVHGELSFRLSGGMSNIPFPPAPFEITAASAGTTGFVGVALCDIEADSYVLARTRSSNNDNDTTPHTFSAAELAPFRNNGRRYTLDFIVLRNGSWTNMRFDNVAIPGYATESEMRIVSFAAENNRAAFDHTAKTASLIVPSTSDLASITPQITLFPPTPLAFPEPASGATVDFSAGPVSYKVISYDLANTNEYLVSLVKSMPMEDGLIGHWLSGETDYLDRSGHKPGVHDAYASGNTANISFSSDHPNGFGGSSLDLKGNAYLQVNNSSSSNPNYEDTFDGKISDAFTVSFWAKKLPPNGWGAWVSKGGENAGGWQIRRNNNNNTPAFTMRGLNNADGTGSQINVNDNLWHHYAGTWEQTPTGGVRRLYVDGALSIQFNAQAGQEYTLLPSNAIRLGSGVNSDAFHIGQIYDVRIFNRELDAAEIATLHAGPLVPPAPEANLLTVSVPAQVKSAAVGYGVDSVVITVLFGTRLNAVTLDFTISEGATCDQVSGAEYDFTSPVLLTVVSSDLALTNVYSVALCDTMFDFDNRTLQGWRNIVWDGEAGAGKWIELAPNETAVPPALNGGQGLIPTSGDNGMFRANSAGIALYSSYNSDNHLNTLWMRSPEFWFPERAACEFSWRWQGGISREPTPPLFVADIPYAAGTNTGWMGVALRRVRDDKFVLVKPKEAGNSNDFNIRMFTAADLAPFIGDYEAYTLDIINADRGTWGWIGVDYVSVDGVSSQPVRPTATMIIIR